MGRVARALKHLLGILRDVRGVSLYETTAVVAMTSIVAAVALPVALDRIENAKQARAANVVIAIANATMRFFENTGRWPGEAEIRRPGSSICFLQTGVPATDPNQGTLLPDMTQLSISSTTGTRLLDARDFLGRSCDTISTLNVLNINNFLVRKPSEVEYPNWAGPYMEPIASDPWDRAYVVNVLPLIFSSNVADPGAGKSAETGGKLGYGWIFSVGPDRLLQTPLDAAQLSAGSDDIGKNIGTRIVKSVGGQSASGLSSSTTTK